MASSDPRVVFLSQEELSEIKECFCGATEENLSFHISENAVTPHLSEVTCEKCGLAFQRDLPEEEKCAPRVVFISPEELSEIKECLCGANGDNLSFNIPENADIPHLAEVTCKKCGRVFQRELPEEEKCDTNAKTILRLSNDLIPIGTGTEGVGLTENSNLFEENGLQVSCPRCECGNQNREEFEFFFLGLANNEEDMYCECVLCKRIQCIMYLLTPEEGMGNQDPFENETDCDFDSLLQQILDKYESAPVPTNQDLAWQKCIKCGNDDIAFFVFDKSVDGIDYVECGECSVTQKLYKCESPESVHISSLPRGKHPLEKRVLITRLDQVESGDHIGWKCWYKPYWHHGIVEYVDFKKNKLNVIHYTMMTKEEQEEHKTQHGNKRKATIKRERVDLTSAGTPYKFDYGPEAVTKSPEDVIKAAETRLNETQYNFITHNCEHFARWCKTGVGQCLQAKQHLATGLKAVGTHVGLIAKNFMMWLVKVTKDGIAAGVKKGLKTLSQVALKRLAIGAEVVGFVAVVAIEMGLACKDIHDVYQQKKEGRITKQKFKQYVKERLTRGGIRSLCTAVGGVIGGIVFPGVGGFVGGLIGSVVGFIINEVVALFKGLSWEQVKGNVKAVGTTVVEKIQSVNERSAAAIEDIKAAYKASDGDVSELVRYSVERIFKVGLNENLEQSQLEE